MTKLTITRGLPGSGKTTWAKQQVQAALADKVLAARINRDDIREASFGKTHGLSHEQERHVTGIAHAQALGLLKGGAHVYVDDTNLHHDTIKGWQRVAHKAGAEFKYADFDVPVEECIRRAYQRAAEGGRAVPAEAIQRMAKRYLKDGEFRPMPVLHGPNSTPYVPPTGKHIDDVYIIDIDGTLTLGPHDRGPFEWHKVGQDLPRLPMIQMVKALYNGTHAEIVFLSGRSEECYEETRGWLRKHLGGIGQYSPLYMRPQGDWRRDDIVKSELFDKHLREGYNVLGVFDDRQQVVDYWRSIGLQVFQVAEGDF